MFRTLLHFVEKKHAVELLKHYLNLFFTRVSGSTSILGCLLGVNFVSSRAILGKVSENFPVFSWFILTTTETHQQ